MHGTYFVKPEKISYNDNKNIISALSIFFNKCWIQKNWNNIILYLILFAWVYIYVTVMIFKCSEEIRELKKKFIIILQEMIWKSNTIIYYDNNNKLGKEKKMRLWLCPWLRLSWTCIVAKMATKFNCFNCFCHDRIQQKRNDDLLLLLIQKKIYHQRMFMNKKISKKLHKDERTSRKKRDMFYFVGNIFPIEINA